MTYNEARKRASMKYQKEHMSRVAFDLPKEGEGLTHDKLKAVAAEAGETVGAYIKNAIYQRMERDGSTYL